MNFLKNNDPIAQDFYKNISWVFKAALKHIHIHKPYFLILSTIILCLSLYIFWERIDLVKNGIRVTGFIESIKATNSISDCAKRVNECTVFEALIRYPLEDTTGFRFYNRIWSVEWFNQPIESSWRKINDAVEVIYHPKNPREYSFENTFKDVWLLPIMLMLVHITLYYRAFSRK